MADSNLPEDLELLALVAKEEKQQAQCLRLIPSENVVSQNVRKMLGSVLVNKYSEGYPGQRYYEGTSVVDQIEDLARERAKKLFQMEHANVQPYSGSPANMAVYYALVPSGGTIMGMGLTDGGHLTHGAPVNYSSRYYRAISYHVNPITGWLDMDEVRKIALENRPQLLICGGSAYSRILDFGAFRKIADEVGAKLMVDMAHFGGLVAAGAYPSPASYADVITMTTHKVLRGPRGAMILCRQSYAKDIDRAIFPGLQGGPHNHTIAGIAIALYEASTPSYRRYGQQVVANAKALAQHLIAQGFDLVTGGTDTHLMLLDLRKRKLTGKPFAQALSQAGIITNANTIPGETGSPKNPSGLRVGTPSVTSQGMGIDEMKIIADYIAQVANHIHDSDKLAQIRQEIAVFTSRFGSEPKF